MALSDEFKDLNITNDELEKFTKAMKDPKFRELLGEYAAEISDPENRKKYEEEIVALEKERGMDIKFVHPQPGHVIKTKYSGSSQEKVFINICTNELIQQPKANRERSTDGKSGLHWTIPHSFTPPRQDVDKTGNRCTVYDVVFHPYTYRMTANQRFKQMLHDTIFDGILRQFDHVLDRENLKFPKMNYKGTPQATVIRTRDPNAAVDAAVDAASSQSDLGLRIPYPDVNPPTSEQQQQQPEQEEVVERQVQPEERGKLKEKLELTGDLNETGLGNNTDKTQWRIVTPRCDIKERHYVDLNDYSTGQTGPADRRPKELVATIHLPALEHSRHLQLDIYARRIVLESQPVNNTVYSLDYPLPYPVDEDNGSAKFNKIAQQLKAAAAGPAEHQQQEEEEEEIELITPMVCSESHIVIPDEQPVPSSTTAAVAATNAAVESFHPERDDVKWIAPRYFKIDQDEKQLICLLECKNVQAPTLTASYDAEQRTATCSFLASAGYNDYYRFTVKLLDGQVVNSGRCRLSKTWRYVVWSLEKTADCQFMWEKVRCGCGDDLQEISLLSENWLKQQYEALMPKPDEVDIDFEQPVTLSPEVELFADDDVLRVVVKPPLTAEDSVDSSSGQLLEEGQSLRRRHFSAGDLPSSMRRTGILKERSWSSSSSQQQNGEARSMLNDGQAPGDAFSLSLDGRRPTRKKSVSFSEHVDLTHFRSSQTVRARSRRFSLPWTVAKMHATLKNKRKRHRKREQRNSGDSIDSNAETEQSQPSSDTGNSPATSSASIANASNTATTTATAKTNPANGYTGERTRRKRRKAKQRNRQNSGGSSATSSASEFVEERDGQLDGTRKADIEKENSNDGEETGSNHPVRTRSSAPVVPLTNSVMYELDS